MRGLLINWNQLKNVATDLAVKHPHKNIPPVSTLERYTKTPTITLIDVTDDVVKSVTHFSGSLGPGGTDSEAL